LLHVTSAFVLVSASQLTTALQPSFYGFTAVYLRLYSRLSTALQPSIYSFTVVYGFIAATCNLVVTFGDAHWAELIRPQRWAGV